MNEIYEIELAAEQRKATNRRCKTIEFRKFGAEQRFRSGCFEIRLPLPSHIAKVLDELNVDESRQMKSAIDNLLSAMYEWRAMCIRQFGRSTPFDDTEWKQIQKNISDKLSNTTMAEKQVTNNYYAPIYNNGTMDGDIIAPTYNCNGDAPEVFEVDNMFDGNMGGIGERSQFWLLLMAAMARGAKFATIPEFVRFAFDKWKVPLNVDDCQKSVQDLLKSKPWNAVKDQQSMIEFIKDIRKQQTVRAADLRVANNLFVALKDFHWG